MWGVIVAWVVCLASLSLPWPGVILVALLCGLALFEFAIPAAWLKKQQNLNNSSGGGNEITVGGRGGGLRELVTSLLAQLAQMYVSLKGWLLQRVGGRGQPMEKRSGSNGEPTEEGDGGGRESAADGLGEAKQQSALGSERAPATFLKGSVGSFSRGGLMVTHEGRVIYKVNQDRGLISHPSLSKAQHTIFGIFDGHGENGEQVAAYAVREVPRRLEQHPDALEDPTTALKHVFEDISSSLSRSGINAIFGGTTAVVALVRGAMVWVANAGDSRALVARKDRGGGGGDGCIMAHGLTWDQNPDSPGERERIESMGGFVSDPEEAGASARVWLDATQTMVGLAMARSIGDLAVKRVGVIAKPEVVEYELTAQDEFLILASDGVWEFIDNQEAAEVVQDFFDKGEDAAGACRGLMELANLRWSTNVGDYRDDITATVVRLPFLPPVAAAAAAATHAAAAASTSPRSRSVVASAAISQPCETETLSSSSGKEEESEPESLEDEASARVGTMAATIGGNNGKYGASSDEIDTALDDGDDGLSGGCTIGGSVGIRMGQAAQSNRTLAAPVPKDERTVSNKAERRLTMASLPKPEPSTIGASSVGEEEKKSEDAGNNAAGPLELTENDDEREEAADRSSSSSTSTPAITPDGSSEEEEEIDVETALAGGGGVAGGKKEKHAEVVSTHLLSAVSEAFETGDESVPSPRVQVTSAKGREAGTGITEAEQGRAAAADTSGEDEREEGGNDAMTDEEWELEFGVREYRAPSREMREASREFPTSYTGAGGAVDPLEALVSGMEATSSGSKRPVTVP